MFIEVVDAFRCTRPHEPTWLVASADRIEARDIITGELGCPVCGARYPITNGVADFRDVERRTPVTPLPAARDLADRAVRAAALLGLTEPGGLVVLAGGWGDAAHEVAALLLEGTHILAVDPDADVSSGFGVSVVRTGSALPLRPESARAIALDAAHAAAPFLDTSVAALRPAGRLLAPSGVALPAGIVERARDAHDWLGEKHVLASLARAPAASR